MKEEYIYKKCGEGKGNFWDNENRKGEEKET